MIEEARIAALFVWTCVFIWCAIGWRSPLRLMIGFQAASAMCFLSRWLFAPDDIALWIGCYALSALVALGFVYVARAYDRGVG